MDGDCSTAVCASACARACFSLYMGVNRNVMGANVSSTHWKRDWLMLGHLTLSFTTKKEKGKRYLYQIYVKCWAKSTSCVWLYDSFNPFCKPPQCKQEQIRLSPADLCKVFGPWTDWAVIIHRQENAGGLTSIHVYSYCPSSKYYTSANITLHLLISVSSQ